MPGVPSRIVMNTGTRVTKRTGVNTGYIGYILRLEFKWKGKITITSSNLERMRAQKLTKLGLQLLLTIKAKLVQIGIPMCHGSSAF